MNESAYPIPERRSDYNEVLRGAQTGLTKRELFAAMAMQGAMQGLGVHSAEFHPDEPVSTEMIAVDAVKMADALLKELAK